jgi:3',5'-cyclic-AMP phosphodiesterase
MDKKVGRARILRNVGSEFIQDDHSVDGIDRRGFLKCMAWAGTGVLWSVGSGLLSSRLLGATVDHPDSGLSFVQISDSHIGFNKAANLDVAGTLTAAVDKINGLPNQPSFIIHTGDLTQIAGADQFDTVDQILKGAKTRTGQVFYVPGEHDVVGDGGALYLQRYGRETVGTGYYSFDIGGVHFIGLVNVVGLDSGALGDLGTDQLKWLADDVRKLPSSTPIVVFAHVPLWEVYPQWGWGTDDGALALSHLKRFGSVTVLNGHIHQVTQKVEGNTVFHTAMSTAFPQPAPGTATKPGPLTVPAGQLGHVLGVTEVGYVRGSQQLALVDSPLVSLAGGGL